MALPPPQRRTRECRFARLLLLASLCLAVTPLPAEVKPDFFAAEKFGFLLKQDFDQRKAEALLERLDGAAMRARVMTPFGEEAANHPSAIKLWEENTFPQFRAQLQSFGPRYSLAPARVALIDGSRWLECVLFGEGGMIRLVSLRLTETAGTIRISDFHFGGSSLEATRAMREILILLGLRPAGALEEEEMMLCDLSDRHQMRLREVFEFMGTQEYDRSFARMLDSSERMQRTPIWRELRNRLALLGSAAAQKHLAAAIARGEPVDAFLRYSISSSRGDRVQALADFDQVLAQYHDLPLLRCLQAGLLLENKQPAAALASCLRILETNPGAGAAYPVAVMAAVLDRREDQAMALLQGWSRISAIADIEKSLTAEAALGPFLAAPRYLAWKQSATEAPPPPASPSAT